MSVLTVPLLAMRYLRTHHAVTPVQSTATPLPKAFYLPRHGADVNVLDPARRWDYSGTVFPFGCDCAPRAFCPRASAALRAYAIRCGGRVYPCTRDTCACLG